MARAFKRTLLLLVSLLVGLGAITVPSGEENECYNVDRCETV
jgi:hypothetical protein